MNGDTRWMDRLACRELIERSVRHVDDGDAQAFSRLFAEDAVLVRPNGAAIEGRAAIYAAYADRPPERLTRHLVTNVVVDFDAQAEAGNDLKNDAGRTATARSYVLLWTASTPAPQSPFGRPADARQLVGEFLDRLAQADDGAWRILRREARFVLHCA